MWLPHNSILIQFLVLSISPSHPAASARHQQILMTGYPLRRAFKRSVALTRDRRLQSASNPYRRGALSSGFADEPDRDRFLKGSFKCCPGHQFLDGAIQEDYPDLGRSYMATAEEEGLEAWWV